MTGQKSVMLCGFGGQGIVLAGLILGKAAVIQGLNAAQSTSYGSESRGSACRSEVIIASTNIIYPHVRKADILGVMSQAGFDKFRHKLTEKSGVLFYDSSLVKVDDNAAKQAIGLPVTEIAVQKLEKKIVANLVFLAAIVKRTNVVSIDALKSAVRQLVPEKFLDLNLRAVKEGEFLGV